MLRFVSTLLFAGFFAATAHAQTAQYPPSAQDGQCFARVLSPVVTQTVVEDVLQRPESFEIEVVPAVYDTTMQRVLVKEATTRFRTIPAVTETLEERILVEPERVEMTVIPAQFETYTETVVVEPERVTWQPGTGLFGRGAGGTAAGSASSGDGVSTGEVLCRVVIPAKTQTVTRSRMVTPPQVQERIVPARYETIRREVVVTPARFEEEVVPAVYEDRPVRVLVTPAQERRISVPAIYTTVEREVVVGGGDLQWAEVLCETNTDRFKVAEIQGALTDAGYPTLIDGDFGPRTQRAMEAFQRANNLSVGYMTVETARALNIDPYGAPPQAVYALLGARDTQA